MRYSKLSAVAFSAFMLCSSAAFTASQQTTTDSPSGTSTSGEISSPVKKPVPPVRPQASITLTCSGGKKYEIATGTSSGTCTINGDYAECTSGSSIAAYASCSVGCGGTSGKGTCKEV